MIALFIACLLSKRELEWDRGRIFFWPQTLTGHSFAAPLPKMMISNMFESPMPYLFEQYLKNSIPYP